MAKSESSLLERLTPVLLFATIVLAFLVGILWQRVNGLEGGGTRVADTAVEPADVNGKLSDEQASNVLGITEDDFIRGSSDAEVFIIEYSDLECPYCASFHPAAVQAIEEYGDQVAWVYRHFPLDTIHPRAVPSANAAECVGNLGGSEAYWTFIDYIFENQNSNTLSDDGLTVAAGIAGVDTGAFTTCYEAEQFSANVDDDYQSGLDAGVTGTPGNFVMNSKGEVWVVPGAVPFDENSPDYQPGLPTLKATIDEALSS